jgi:hypothetical protein
VQFVVRLDAAGQYADNLLHFLHRLGHPGTGLPGCSAPFTLGSLYAPSSNRQEYSAPRREKAPSDTAGLQLVDESRVELVECDVSAGASYSPRPPSTRTLGCHARPGAARSPHRCLRTLIPDAADPLAVQLGPVVHPAAASGRRGLRLL